MPRRVEYGYRRFERPCCHICWVRKSKNDLIVPEDSETTIVRNFSHYSPIDKILHLRLFESIITVLLEPHSFEKIIIQDDQKVSVHVIITV
jgi:hypothetical protein